MEAAPVHIIQYFDGSKQGIIPLFQRPYSWEPKDWNTLWDDLMGQYDEDERASHFMGAIVTVPVRSVPVGVGKHLVIDGQQRLTTLSILLAAIRDCASAVEDNATAGIIGDLLVNRHYKAPDDLKLVPTQTDRAAYNALVYSKDIAPYEESKVIQAYRHFRKKLEGSDLNDEPMVPARTLQAIQQSLQVVMINLGESDDPYLIFESLNHKGRPLSQGDLVRNYVLMRFQHSTSAGGEQESVYEDLWRPMESSLNASMTEFLRHYGMRYGKNVRKGDIYSASKLEFEKLKDVADVRASLLAMKQASVAYQGFISPDTAANPKIAVRLQGMLDLDSTVFYPLLIRLFRLASLEAIAGETQLQCLDVLESFYVRRLVCNVPTNALNQITLELCANLSEHNPHIWLRENLAKGSSGRRWPSDQEFADALVTGRLYPRRKLARFMLEALEGAFDHKEPISTTTATMEHIMPQTLSDAWRDSLGPDVDRMHERWIDTLGNLTLTGYNPELGNLPFEAKKAKLANTHFELSRSLLSSDEWGPKAIESRGHALAAIAVRRWARE
jgi:uncharacterized protein with ParB-like and HNH nuclease domain